jgi:hypothetical protein
VIENPVELIDRVRTKGVSHLRPVERNAYSANVIRPVIGDVGEFEARHWLPRRWVKDVRNHVSSVGCLPGDTVVTDDSRHSIPVAFSGSGG